MAARKQALWCLLQVIDHGHSLNAVMPELAKRISDPRDKALSQELVYGVMRYHPRLNWIASQLLQKRFKPKDQDLAMIVEMALYQLFEMRVPDHAAVNAAVELVVWRDKEWAKGVVNGVLRNAIRQREEIQTNLQKKEVPLFSHPSWMLKFMKGNWPQHWRDAAEAALEDALNDAGLDWELQPGEGAFYGPKIEFSLRDCLNRVWQCGTIQLDFMLPERLGAQYVDEDNERKTPVMLHRAILGSFERFIGILIEHYAGAFPAWLAPKQVAILNITDNQGEYCTKIEESLKIDGIRASADLRNEKIGFKIREHTLHKVPYLIVVGDKEIESNTVAVRTRKGDDLGTMSLDAFKELLAKDVARRGRVETE